MEVSGALRTATPGGFGNPRYSRLGSLRCDAKRKSKMKTILVVDDNPTNLKLVADVLEFEGYSIMKAADAEEAQVLVKESLPDLILMDIALPGMDGLTLTRKLKAAEETKNICVVALTAFAMKGDDQKALDAGCDGYITKPIDTRKLPELVSAFLQRNAEHRKGICHESSDH
jgi:CheY-like chemotaxis protein